MLHAVIPERKGVEAKMFLLHLQQISVATNEEIFVDIANGLKAASSFLTSLSGGALLIKLSTHPENFRIISYNLHFYF